MKSGADRGKIFNDPIHGHIEVSSLAVRVMDTPQFQRLRDISQLGSTYYVFAGASSNRFEHCLGVSYLAKVFVNNLRTNQPELAISDEEVLCVEIAGLCHDLGHGPFSHLYDGKLLPLILHNHKFEHEHASIGLLDLLIQENGLLPVFQSYGLDLDHIHFIKELMLGDPKDAPPGFVWRGRQGRGFLYDIVANKRNGIDVDKFDYFARDCHMLGLTKSFDCMRLMKFARVFSVKRPHLAREDDLEVMFHVKEAWNIFELFHTRYTLHKRAYQHRVCVAVDLMIVQALYLAEEHYKIPGTCGVPRRLSECISDMQAYSRMSEYIFRAIEFSSEDQLEPARAMIRRLRVRDLFPFCGETILSHAVKSRLLTAQASAGRHGEKLESTITRQLLGLIGQGSSEPNAKRRRAEEVPQEALVEVKTEDVFVTIVHVGYGKGNSNPISEATTAFYEPVKAHEGAEVPGSIHLDAEGVAWRVRGLPEDTISRILPREFEEVYVRVYGRFKSQAPLLKAAFAQWCKELSEQLDDQSPRTVAMP